MPPRVESQLSDALIEGLGDPAIGVDRVGVVRVFNHEAGQVFNISPEEAIGRDIWDILPLSEFTRALISQIKETEPHPVEQVMVLPGDKLYAVRIFPVRTARRRNLGAVCILRDMAGVQKIEKGLDQILRDLSRRISVPLTSIKGFVETLLEGAYGDPNITKRFLQIINEETNRLVRLVMTLEESANLNSGLVVSKSRTRLESVVDAAVEMFTPIAAGRNVTIERLYAEGLPWVEVDSALLRKAVVNVVDNAVRFSAVNGQGKVTISVAKVERNVTICVRDDGIGIAANDLPHVFERFYRSELEPAASLGGTGLGLTVAQEIVEGHGGTVVVHSDGCQGTEVTITVPIR